MSTAAILWMGRCFANLAIWAWSLASTNSGLIAPDRLMEKCQESSFKEMGEFACAFRILELKHHTSCSSKTIMKYGFFFFSFLFFFLFFLHIMLFEDTPVLLLYLIILHSINYKMHQIYLCSRLCKSVRQTFFNFFFACKSQSVKSQSL